MNNEGVFLEETYVRNKSPVTRDGQPLSGSHPFARVAHSRPDCGTFLAPISMTTKDSSARPCPACRNSGLDEAGEDLQWDRIAHARKTSALSLRKQLRRDRVPTKSEVSSAAY